MITRRDLFTGAALLAGSALLKNDALAGAGAAVASQGDPGDYTPVITPNNVALPYKIVDGVKVFHLIAEEVPKHEFAPGLVAHCWGFNGRVHGPTIEAVEGDRVRIYVTNKLPEPTSMHWHGLILPSGMDGVGGLSQKLIDPGETFQYEFTLRQHGTYMYHPHSDEMTQMALGMMGMFIIHERQPARRPDRDFAFMLSEWSIKAGTSRPDPSEMTDFNVFTFNGRVFPGTDPMVVRKGDLVRIRLGNLGAMEHHPIHLHGYHFQIVATDGGDIPAAAQWPAATVLVPVGSTRTIEFIADNPGDWAMHCHMTHHVMTQMGHGLPNLIGINKGGFDKRVHALLPGYMTMGQNGTGGMGDMGMRVPPNSLPMAGGPGPFDYIDMGGMFTLLKVRENLASYDADPGWYQAPPGTQAQLASNADLQRDLGFVPGAG
jgi:FtsP/CotA-like multicopper oxidase with cupredoxin domain